MTSRKRKRMNVIGDEYGSWTVLSDAEVPERFRKKVRYVLARCDCGGEHIVSLGNIRSGRSTRCLECGRKSSGDRQRLPEGEKKPLSCPCGEDDVTRYEGNHRSMCSRCRKRGNRNGICGECGGALYKSKECPCGSVSTEEHGEHGDHGEHEGVVIALA